MKAFDYSSAATLEEAFTALGTDLGQPARPLAGGTDLLTLMKARVTEPERLVDIKRVPGLRSGIFEEPGGIRIGALTPLAEIERSALLRERCTALVEAAEVAASPQLRNMATLGGNLLQRPRCWYFRNHLLGCWLKGGDHCPARDGQNELHALFGDSPCVAVHPSDLVQALTALDAEVTLQSPNDERTLKMADFFALPEDGRRTETTIRQDELVMSVRIPTAPEGTRSAYLKAMDRKIWAFALVSVAAMVRLQDGAITDARLVLGGVAPIPWRVPAAEQLLLGSAPNEALFARAAEAALAGARPLEHNGYKIPLEETLVRRVLAAVVGNGFG